jgi:signal transduction histidine kinase
MYTASLTTLATSPMLDDIDDVQQFQLHARPVAEYLGGDIVVIGPDLDHPVGTHISAVGTPIPDKVPSDVQRALAPAVSSVFGGGSRGVSNLFLEPVSKRLMLVVMVPVERSGRARRALALIIGSLAIQELLVAQALPSGTFVAVADGERRILASTAAVPRPVVGSAAPHWMDDVIGDRRSGLFVGPGLSGHDNVYAVEAIDHAPAWRIAVAQRYSSQGETAWRGIRWSIAGVGTIGLAMAVAAWLIRQESVKVSRTEAAVLRASQASIERLHRGLPTVIYLRDVAETGQSRLLYRGGDLEAVLGWPARTFDGLDSYREWTDMGEEVESAFLRAVLRDGTGRIEYRMWQPDGSRRWLRVNARRLTCRPGHGGELVGYVQDISAEKAAEAQTLAVARLTALGEISGALVHELRQPLATIAGAAENAREDAQELGASHIDGRLKRICDQAHHASEVLRSLWRFTRGVVDASEMEDVPLAAIVNRCLEVADVALRSASIEVRVDLGGKAAPLVRAHPALLEQVLSNLIHNAHDALVTRPPSLRRCISIRATRSDAAVAQLIVADTGGGISQAILPRLFSPFLTTKSRNQGTGLGLWISHSLLVGMGGTIAARNAPDGAVFEVTLPLGGMQHAASRSAASGPASGSLVDKLRRKRP